MKYEGILIAPVIVVRWGTNLYMPLFSFVRPSICPSAVHHVSGTVHYLINDVSPGVFFSFFKKFLFFGQCGW